jgi:hypothetical protein
MPLRTGPSLPCHRPTGSIVPLIFLVLILRMAAPSWADQDPPETAADADLIETLRSLHAQERWMEIVELAPVSPDGPAEADYYRGLALARMERWR